MRKKHNFIKLISMCICRIHVTLLQIYIFKMCECVIFLLFLTCRGNQSSFWNSGAGVELIVFILSYHTLPTWARHASLYLFGYPIISINTHGPSPSKAALLKCIFVTVGALTNYVFFVWMYFNLHKWHRMAHLIIFLISPSNTMH